EFDVSFWNVFIEAFREDHKAYYDQEAAGKHLDRGVFINEATNPSGESDHNTNREHNCDYHNDNLIGKPYCCENGVERKNNIEQNDLDDDAGNIHRLFSQYLFFIIRAFGLVIDFACTFCDQKQTAENQNDIA